MEQEQDFIPTRDDIEAALADPEAETPELSVLSPEEKIIGAKILPGLAARIRAKAEADAAKSLADKTQELIAQNSRMMKDEVDKLRASIQPPDAKQLEQLLSQEYGTMEVVLFNRKQEKTVFTLRELPQAAEKRMFEIIRERIVPHMKEIASVEWSASATQLEKLQKVLAVIPDGLDMLAACCAICLDPFKESANVSAEWVQANMSSNRIMTIIEAQLEISKIRDFGSAVYRLLPS